MADSAQLRWWQASGGRIALALATVLLIGVRRHGDLRRPQFWADDGSVFFVQADRHPAGAILIPYAGTWHAAPRLVAALGHALPIFWLPAWYAAAALALVGLVAWTLLSPRVGLPAAWAATLAIGALPAPGEVYLNLCHLSWILALGLVGLGLMSDPARRREKAGEGAWTVLLGLTGPGILGLWPLFLWRALRQRSRWSVALLLLALAAAGVQLACLLAAPFPAPPASLPSRFDLAALGHRLIFLGLPLEIARDPGTGLALSLLLGLASAWACWRRRRAAPAAALLLACSLGLALAGWYRLRAHPGGLNDETQGGRYFFAAKTLWVWLVAVLASLGGVVFRRWAIALAVVALITSAAHFVIPRQPDLHWRRSSALLRGGRPVTVPTPPRGWLLVYPGRPGEGGLPDPPPAEAARPH